VLRPRKDTGAELGLGHSTLASLNGLAGLTFIGREEGFESMAQIARPSGTQKRWKNMELQEWSRCVMAVVFMFRLQEAGKMKRSQRHLLHACCL